MDLLFIYLLLFNMLRVRLFLRYFRVGDFPLREKNTTMKNRIENMLMKN